MKKSWFFSQTIFFLSELMSRITKENNQALFCHHVSIFVYIFTLKNVFLSFLQTAQTPSLIHQIIDVEPHS